MHATSMLGVLLLGFAPWLLWLFGAAVLGHSISGAARRFADRRRFDSTTDVRKLDPYQFETYVGEHYRRRGWTVRLRGGRRSDGGVDLVIQDPSRRILVQCKHWKAWTVGVRPVRELWGVVGHEHATGAVFVTSGRYTKEALAFAAGKQLELIDGDRLGEMVAEVRAAGGIPAAGAAAQGRVARACPSCGAQMVIRTARRGPNPGEQFWGCTRFPSCRQIVALAAPAN